MALDFIKSLYRKLPAPFSVSEDQIIESYKYLYEILTKYYNEKNYKKFSETAINTSFCNIILSFPLNDRELLLKFVTFLTDVITTFPVKSPFGQRVAINFLNDILAANPNIKDLKINWKPFYKIFKYFLINGKENTIYFTDNNIKVFTSLANKLCSYFPEGTAHELSKKLFPKISPKGWRTSTALALFCLFYPKNEHNYKPHMKVLMSMLKDTSNKSYIFYIVKVIIKIIKANPNDDFSEITNYIFQLINMIFLNGAIAQFSLKYFEKSGIFQLTKTPQEILGTLVVLLFLSHSSRRATLYHYYCLFTSFKMLSHPSVDDNSSEILIFIDSIDDELKKYYKKKHYFAVNLENPPTESEIHAFISPICEIRISLLRLVKHKKLAKYSLNYIRFETMIDPLLFERYYNFGTQLLDLSRVDQGMNQGLSILMSLIPLAHENQIIFENFESLLFQGIEFLNRNDTQIMAANFLLTAFSSIPLISDNSHVNINYSEIAYLLTFNIMEIFRRLPSANEKAAKMTFQLKSPLAACYRLMLQRAEKAVFERVYSIFVDIVNDNSIAPGLYDLSDFFRNFCFYAPKEISEFILQAFKKKLNHQHKNLMMHYLLHIYGSICLTKVQSIEEIKQHIDFLLKFTNSNEQKICKYAWSAISNAFASLNYSYQPIVTHLPNTNVEVSKNINPFRKIKIEEYNIKWTEPIKCQSLILDTFNIIFEKLESFLDQNEIYQLLKITSKAISQMLENTFEVPAQTFDGISESFCTPILKIPELYKNGATFRGRVLTTALNLLNKCSENIRIIERVCNILISYFGPHLFFFSDPDIRIQKLYYKMELQSTNDICIALSNFLAQTFSIRHNQYLIPITDDLIHIFRIMTKFGTNEYESIKQRIFSFLYHETQTYTPFFENFLSNYIDDYHTIENFLDFIQCSSIQNVIYGNYEILCKTLAFISNDDIIKKVQKKGSIEKINCFLMSCIQDIISTDIPEHNYTPFVRLLTFIEDKIKNNDSIDKTSRNIWIYIILISLKFVKDISDTLYSFIIESSIQYFDNSTSFLANYSLLLLCYRKQKYSKNRITASSKPKAEDFPNILEKVNLIYPQDGILLNYTNSFDTEEAQDENQDILNIDNIDDLDEDEINKMLEELENENNGSEDPKEYQEDERNTQVEEVFKFFEDTDIQWDEQYIDPFFSDQSNGYFQYKDTMTVKTHIYFDIPILSENISLLIDSIINNVFQENTSSIPCQEIFSYISSIIGPDIINIIRPSFIKHLSSYTSTNAKYTTLSSILVGIFSEISQWNKNERIQFLKLLALPTIFVIGCSNDNSISQIIKSDLLFVTQISNPLVFSPLYKAIFDLSPKASTPNFRNQSLRSFNACLSTFNPFKSLNLTNILFNELIVPFLKNGSSYKMISCAETVDLFYGLLGSCCLHDKESPLYSPKMEEVRKLLLGHLETILLGGTAEGKVKFATISAILKLFSGSLYDVAIEIAPILCKCLERIIFALNTCTPVMEDLLIISLGQALSHPVFALKSDLQLKVVQAFVNSLPKIALPLRMALLDILNVMITSNLHGSTKEELETYENLILKLAPEDCSEGQLIAISSIYGVIIMYKNSIEHLNCMLNNQNDNTIIEFPKEDKHKMKVFAASIILNSYIFDKIDENLVKAFSVFDDLTDIIRPGRNSFVKEIARTFWDRHSEQILPSVEDTIAQYKSLYSPDYTC